MPHSLLLEKEIFFSVNVGVFKGPICRKSMGVLSAVWCSVVPRHYTRAIRQITQAPLLYIHLNDWLSIVTKQHADILPSSCAQTCTMRYKHTICDVDIFVVQLSH